MSRVKKSLLGVLLTLLAVCVAMGIMLGLSKPANAEMGADEFSVQEGAQMRTVEPNGIRFTGKIGANKYNEVFAKDSGKKIGMFIVPEFYFTDYADYKAAHTEYKGTSYEYFRDIKENVIDHIFLQDELVSYDGGYIAKVVCYDILFDNTNLNFVGGLFIETTVDSTKTYTVVDGTSSSRSLGYIATAAYNAGERSEFIEKTNEKAAYRKLGVTQLDNGKYMYLGEEYDLLEDVPVKPETAYELNFTEKTIVHNTNFTLTLSNSTGLKVDWASNNTAVATVDNGTVTGVAKGEAVITATIGKYSYTCIVSVTHDNETPVSYGIYKVTSCSCGADGYYASNTVNSDGTFYNSDFEKSTIGQIPVGWVDMYTAQTTTADATTAKESQPKNNANGKFVELYQGGSKGIISNAFNVTAGETIAVDYRYCTSGNVKDNVYFKFYKVNGSGTLDSIDSTKITIGAGESWNIWVNSTSVPSLTRMVAVVPAGYTFASIAVYGYWNGASNYFDDFKISRYSISDTSVDLQHSGTKQLTAVGLTNPVWASSDDTIATVDQTGLVTASSTNVGVVSITATANGVTLTCTVNVAHNFVEEDNIKSIESISGYGINKVTYKDESVAYKANTIDSFGNFLNSDFENVATGSIPDGWVSGIGGGESNIKAADNSTTINNCAKNATYLSYGKYLDLNADNTIYVLSKAVEVKAGDTLTLKFRYCTNGNSTTTVKFRWAGIEDGDPKYLDSETYTTIGNDQCWNIWTTSDSTSVTLTDTVPEGYQFAIVTLYKSWGGAAISFDDFRITGSSVNGDVEGLKTYACTCGLSQLKAGEFTNGNFENGLAGWEVASGYTFIETGDSTQASEPLKMVMASMQELV